MSRVVRVPFRVRLVQLDDIRQISRRKRRPDQSSVLATDFHDDTLRRRNVFVLSRVVPISLLHARPPSAQPHTRVTQTTRVFESILLDRRRVRVARATRGVRRAQRLDGALQRRRVVVIFNLHRVAHLCLQRLQRRRFDLQLLKFPNHDGRSSRLRLRRVRARRRARREQTFPQSRRRRVRRRRDGIDDVRRNLSSTDVTARRSRLALALGRRPRRVRAVDPVRGTVRRDLHLIPRARRARARAVDAQIDGENFLLAIRALAAAIGAVSIAIHRARGIPRAVPGRADTMTTMRSRGRRERDARGVRAHARRTRDVLARSFLARTIARVRRVRSTRRDAEGATPAVCSYPFMGRVC